jgi:hypothetical protein
MRNLGLVGGSSGTRRTMAGHQFMVRDRVVAIAFAWPFESP